MTPTRILVHADRAIGELIDEILRGAGYTVTVRAPTCTTWNLADELPPSVIVFHSIDESDGTGRDLLERFGFTPFTGETSLLVLSSRLSPNTLVRRFDDGVPTIVIGMPFDIDRLVNSVEQLVTAASIPRADGSVIDRHYPGDDIALS